MEIRLLAFATASDALGAEERRLEVAEGSTVADLKTLLGERHPELAALWPRLAVAMDGKIVGDGETLTANCEVALLPPVSGGTEPARAAIVEEPIDIAATTALEVVQTGSDASADGFLVLLDVSWCER